MTTTESWTNGRLLTWTTDYLTKHGSSSPRLDCEILLAHASECERIHLYASFNDEPTEQVRAAFREMVKRRAEGTPVAYLVGFKEFYSANFEVNPDVLIPRPETEHLVVEAIDQAKEIRKTTGQGELSVADIGTGSGVIAVTIANHVPNCNVLAMDVSLAALEVAKRNAVRNNVAGRIEFIEGNLLEGVADDQQFDLILSNPPYVSQNEFDNLDASVREYEPKLALVGGQEGFELIRELLNQAKSKLTSHGSLIIEFSPMLAERQCEFVDSNWKCVKVVKDLAQHSRALVLRLT